MSDLIARLEAAEEGSRELDFAIAEHLGMHPRWSKSTTKARKMHRHVDGGPIPAWTGGIDAALTLVPEGWDYSIGTDTRKDESARKYGWARVMERAEDHPGHYTGNELYAEAATPALALCAAALKARESENGRS